VVPHRHTTGSLTCKHILDLGYCHTRILAGIILQHTAVELTTIHHFGCFLCTRIILILDLELFNSLNCRKFPKLLSLDK
jgi:hypothetical protein